MRCSTNALSARMFWKWWTAEHRSDHAEVSRRPLASLHRFDFPSDSIFRPTVFATLSPVCVPYICPRGCIMEEETALGLCVVSPYYSGSTSRAVLVGSAAPSTSARVGRTASSHHLEYDRPLNLLRASRPLNLVWLRMAYPNSQIPA